MTTPMVVSAGRRCFTVALVGNPNTGKSTLFSALVGVYQRVGNYPGVTVEKRTGRFEFGGQFFNVIDLPGLYSLAARSRDELVAVDVLLGREPGVDPVDVIVCVVDASNLERNFYLVSQILELGIPTVIALNMIDVAERRGILIDVEELSRRLQVPVVRVQAHRGVGIGQLRQVLSRVSQSAAEAPSFSLLPQVFLQECDQLLAELAARGLLKHLNRRRATATTEGEQGGEGDTRWDQAAHRFWAGRILLDSTGFLQKALWGNESRKIRRVVESARARLKQHGFGIPEEEIQARYDWIHPLLDGVVTFPNESQPTVSDRLDAVLTHRIWGTAIFAAVMFLMFQAVFRLAAPLNELIEVGIQGIATWLTSQMPPGTFRSLLVDGVLGGVGAVLTFIPQIAILFAFVAVLEDCGYVARAALLMDRFMSRIGLGGKSFIPMLSSFACAVPGIMATRTIDNERDRLTTILVAPLMTCSARLPVYALLIAAFIPDQRYLGGIIGLQGLVLASLYALGIVTATLVALTLKTTLFRGRSPTFVMELPSYKWPSPWTVLMRVWERVAVFVRNAGTVITAISVLVWAGLYYPHNPRDVDVNLLRRQQELILRRNMLPPQSPQRQSWDKELEQIEREINMAYQRNSFMGRLGRTVEPVFRPLGWDWRIGTAVIVSFPAREVVVATLGVMFDLGEIGADDPSEGTSRFYGQLRSAVWEGTNRTLFNIPVALSLMVFYALCAQCAATLAVIGRETNSWRWPLFTFAYMTILAYLGALAAYQMFSTIIPGI
ncbi:MAG: ferrous iron transport protein B [Thermogutta sp.]